MRAVAVWADKVHDKQNQPQPIYCVAFREDGTQLIAGAGARVLVYEAADGDLIESLKGHKDTVYCVAYSKDMKRFASGDRDKPNACVIIWNGDTLEGILKYVHQDSIQCLSFNPVTHQLASCTQGDFGFWSAESKAVSKYQIKSKITCASWTNDGRYIALGLYNGNISIRDRTGDERVIINRASKDKEKNLSPAPVWSVTWNPSEEGDVDCLAVCDWNQRLTFYMLSGRQIGKEKKLDYDPCCASYFTSGEFIVIGGSDKKASLYTKEGVKLHTITEQNGWVWSCAVRPRQNYVAISCYDGTIALFQLIFSTVHGLYKDRYAYRKLMTDVVLQDLTAVGESQHIRIKCKDLVKKIAIYKDRLAVQLPNQINIYDIPSNGVKPKKPTHVIKENFECNLLVVCSSNVILCQEKRLQCLNFNGNKDREWVMEASIRYIKVIGGPGGREGLLVGLKNGQILKIFVDNPFPIDLIKQGTPVRCLDLSASRRKLAVVDDQNTCIVYDLDTKETLFQEPHANSVAWNTQNENMLCFSGDGQLHIKAGNFPLHKQKLQGFVVGFQGSNIYCLHVYKMETVPVPQSSSMHQYLNQGEFDEAYKIACLGVTDSDWRELGLAALLKLELTIAKNSFIRTHDMRNLELVNNIMEMKKRPEYIEDEVLQAKVHAHRGDFGTAAELYERSGNRKLAMEMYSDLRMFEMAKRYMDDDDSAAKRDLMKRQADWSKSAKDPAVMIDIFLQAGEIQQAVDLMGKNGMYQQLIEKAREVSAGETKLLASIASWLSKLGQVILATEVYNKVGDEKGLAQLYITHKKWDEAFTLIERNPDLKEEVYLPYANYLAEVDKYEEAQDAFREAGHPDKAIKVLQVLTHNAVVESRYDDAAYYFWQLSMSVLDDMTHQAEEEADGNGVVDPALEKKFADYQLRANVYYAYDAIHRFTMYPFTDHAAETLFAMARFLSHIPEVKTYLGISQVTILYTLAKKGEENLAAFKTARYAYEQLLALKVPPNLRERVDLGAVNIRSKPFADDAELLPVCYRCSTRNENINASGLRCFNCNQPFVFSYITFEVLPLIEFTIDEDIDDDEATKLINDDRAVAPLNDNGKSEGGADVMRMDDDGGDSSADAFSSQYMDFKPEDPDTPLVNANREMLASMPSTEVYVQEWPAPLKNRFFRNVLPVADFGVTLSDNCNRFFQTEDYELHVLRKGRCPFSRAKVQFQSAAESDA
eukprot:m.23057 g.23057  ORF g.23057 m.23057 type:complete len:1216 (-) comp14047_c1_seq1:211-3858(-)